MVITGQLREVLARPGGHLRLPALVINLLPALRDSGSNTAAGYYLFIHSPSPKHAGAVDAHGLCLAFGILAPN